MLFALYLMPAFKAVLFLAFYLFDVGSHLEQVSEKAAYKCPKYINSMGKFARPPLG